LSFTFLDLLFKLLLERIRLKFKLLVLTLNRIELLNLGLCCREALLQRSFGCFEQSNLSLILDLLLHVSLILGHEHFDLVFELL